jgi:hypothetical protein
MAASIWPRGTAPVTLPVSTPFFMNTSSGMPWTLKREAVRGFSSTFSLAKRTSVRSYASAPMTGAMIRQGPHQAAQKSTTNAPPRTV